MFWNNTANLRRSPMPKCDFNKIGFPKNTPGGLLLYHFCQVEYVWEYASCKEFILINSYNGTEIFPTISSRIFADVLSGPIPLLLFRIFMTYANFSGEISERKNVSAFFWLFGRLNDASFIWGMLNFFTSSSKKVVKLFCSILRICHRSSIY